MKKPLAAAIAATALLALTGCVQSMPTGGSAVTTPSETPSPTPTTATASQFASVVSENSKSWVQFEDERFKCNLAMGDENSDALGAATAQACAFQAKTLTITATTTLNSFDRLGEPPAEISDLVARTRKILGPISKLDPEPCVKAPTSAACDENRTTFTFPTMGLSGVIDAWKPYTKG